MKGKERNRESSCRAYSDGVPYHLYQIHTYKNILVLLTIVREDFRCVFLNDFIIIKKYSVGTVNHGFNLNKKLYAYRANYHTPVTYGMTSPTNLFSMRFIVPRIDLFTNFVD